MPTAQRRARRCAMRGETDEAKGGKGRALREVDRERNPRGFPHETFHAALR